ncbi:Ice nucleation protein [Actinoplanes sp. SE50]|nr:Ice nucleation protein [Actinoplanes sp. SE50/110]ATO80880.1 Ice nucleation protein [Actinoplanes sp. SE50]SLL98287.1 hypothetical protein ACSP50_1513 [Actinoplanes sp. SE50/110]
MLDYFSAFEEWLPGWADWLSHLVIGEIPLAHANNVYDLADQWERLADELNRTYQDIVRAADPIVENWSGDASASAFVEQWYAYLDSLRQTAEGAGEMRQGVQNFGLEVELMKFAVAMNLFMLAVQIWMMIAGAGPTGGATLTGAPPAFWGFRALLGKAASATIGRIAGIVMKFAIKPLAFVFGKLPARALTAGVRFAVPLVTRITLGHMIPAGVVRGLVAQGARNLAEKIAGKWLTDMAIKGATNLAARGISKTVANRLAAQALRDMANTEVRGLLAQQSARAVQKQLVKEIQQQLMKNWVGRKVAEDVGENALTKLAVKEAATVGLGKEFGHYVGSRVAFGAGFMGGGDLAGQLVQMGEGNRDSLDWGHVKDSAIQGGVFGASMFGGITGHVAGGALAGGGLDIMSQLEQGTGIKDLNWTEAGHGAVQGAEAGVIFGGQTHLEMSTLGAGKLQIGKDLHILSHEDGSFSAVSFRDNPKLGIREHLVLTDNGYAAYQGANHGGDGALRVVPAEVSARPEVAQHIADNWGPEPATVRTESPSPGVTAEPPAAAPAAAPARVEPGAPARADGGGGGGGGGGGPRQTVSGGGGGGGGGTPARAGEAGPSAAADGGRTAAAAGRSGGDVSSPVRTPEAGTASGSPAAGANYASSAPAEHTAGAADRAAPGTGDRGVPGAGDRSAPGAGDRGVPGAGDRSAPGAGDRGVPGAGDRTTPDAGRHSGPDAGERSVGQAGEPTAPDSGGRGHLPDGSGPPPDGGTPASPRSETPSQVAGRVDGTAAPDRLGGTAAGSLGDSPGAHASVDGVRPGGDGPPPGGDRVGPAGRGSAGMQRSPAGADHGLAGGDRAPVGSDRAPVGSDRARVGSDRAAVDRAAVDRAAVGNDRAPIGGERGPAGGDRAAVGGERGAIGGDRAASGRHGASRGDVAAGGETSRGRDPWDGHSGRLPEGAGGPDHGGVPVRASEPGPGAGDRQGHAGGDAAGRGGDAGVRGGRGEGGPDIPDRGDVAGGGDVRRIEPFRLVQVDGAAPDRPVTRPEDVETVADREIGALIEGREPGAPDLPHRADFDPESATLRVRYGDGVTVDVSVQVNESLPAGGPVLRRPALEQLADGTWRQADGAAIGLSPHVPAEPGARASYVRGNLDNAWRALHEEVGGQLRPPAGEAVPGGREPAPHSGEGAPRDLEAIGDEGAAGDLPPSRGDGAAADAGPHDGVPREAATDVPREAASHDGTPREAVTDVPREAAPDFARHGGADAPRDAVSDVPAGARETPRDALWGLEDARPEVGLRDHDDMVRHAAEPAEPPLPPELTDGTIQSIARGRHVPEPLPRWAEEHLTEAGEHGRIRPKPAEAVAEHLRALGDEAVDRVTPREWAEPPAHLRGLEALEPRRAEPARPVEPERAGRPEQSERSEGTERTERSEFPDLAALAPRRPEATPHPDLSRGPEHDGVPARDEAIARDEVTARDGGPVRDEASPRAGLPAREDGLPHDREPVHEGAEQAQDREFGHDGKSGHDPAEVPATPHDPTDPRTPWAPGETPPIDDLIPRTDEEAALRADAIDAAIQAKLHGHEFAGNEVRVRSGRTQVGRDYVVVELEVLTPEGQRVGEITRGLFREPDGTVWVKHNRLEMTEDARGHGFASRFNRHMEGWYRESGASFVELRATKVGGYSWAAAGYEWQIHGGHEVMKGLKEQVDAIGRDLRNLDRYGPERLRSLYDKFGGANPDELARNMREQSRDAQDLLDRAKGVADGTKPRHAYPVPGEIARLGYRESLHGTDRAHQHWLGKDAMVDRRWTGRRYLDGPPPEEFLGYDPALRAEPVGGVTHTASGIEGTRFVPDGRPEHLPDLTPEEMRDASEHVDPKDFSAGDVEAVTHRGDHVEVRVRGRAEPEHFVVEVGRDMDTLGKVSVQAGTHANPHVVQVNHRVAPEQLSRVWVHEITETLAMRHTEEVGRPPQGLLRRAASSIGRFFSGGDAPARPPVEPHAAARMNERLHLQRQLREAAGDPVREAQLRHEITGVERDLRALGHNVNPFAVERPAGLSGGVLGSRHPTPGVHDQVTPGAHDHAASGAHDHAAPGVEDRAAAGAHDPDGPSGPDGTSGPEHLVDPPWQAGERPPVGDLIPHTREQAERWHGAIQEAVKDRYEGRTYGDKHVEVNKVEIAQHAVRVHVRVLDEAGRQVGRSTQWFRRQPEENFLVVKNEAFYLAEGVQGGGFAGEFNDHLEGWYRESGVRYIHVNTEKVGGFAWAREGYAWEPRGGVHPIQRLRLEADRIDELLDGLSRRDADELRPLYRKYGGENPSELRDNMISQRQEAREIYNRMLAITRGERLLADWPTTEQVLAVGDRGEHGRDAHWVGKDALLTSSWAGIKHLEPAVPPRVAEWRNTAPQHLLAFDDVADGPMQRGTLRELAIALGGEGDHVALRAPDLEAGELGPNVRAIPAEPVPGVTGRISPLLRPDHLPADTDVIVGYGQTAGVAEARRDAFPDARVVQIIDVVPTDPAHLDVLSRADLVIAVGPEVADGLRAAFTEHRADPIPPVHELIPPIDGGPPPERIPGQGGYHVLATGDERSQLAAADAVRRLRAEGVDARLTVALRDPEGAEAAWHADRLAEAAGSEVTVRRLPDDVAGRRELLRDADVVLDPVARPQLDGLVLQAAGDGVPVLAHAESGAGRLFGDPEKVSPEHAGRSVVPAGTDAAGWVDRARQAFDPGAREHALSLSRELQERYGPAAAARSVHDAIGGLGDGVARVRDETFHDTLDPREVVRRNAAGDPPAGGTTRVMTVCTEYDSNAGGVITANRELSESFRTAGAEVYGRVSLVSQSRPELTRLTTGQGIEVRGVREVWGVLDEKDRPDRRAMSMLLDNLPAEVDVIVGNSRFGGGAARVLQEHVYPEAKYVHVLHTSPEVLDGVRGLPAEGHDRAATERALMDGADLVTGIGPLLGQEAGRLAWEASPERPVPAHTIISDMPRDTGPAPSRSPGGGYELHVRGRADDAIKGVDMAARMVRELRAEGVDVRLTVRGAPDGQGPMMADRLTAIAGHPVEVREFVPSGTPEGRAELRQDLMDADLVLMPSIQDGFGLVASEAAQAGVPVVVPEGTGAGMFFGDSRYVPEGLGEAATVRDGNTVAALRDRVDAVAGDAEVLPKKVVKDLLTAVDDDRLGAWVDHVRSALTGLDRHYARAGELRDFLGERYAPGNAARGVLDVLRGEAPADPVYSPRAVTERTGAHEGAHHVPERPEMSAWPERRAATGGFAWPDRPGPHGTTGSGHGEATTHGGSTPRGEATAHDRAAPRGEETAHDRADGRDDGPPGENPRHTASPIEDTAFVPDGRPEGAADLSVTELHEAAREISGADFAGGEVHAIEADGRHVITVTTADDVPRHFVTEIGRDMDDLAETRVGDGTPGSPHVVTVNHRVATDQLSRVLVHEISETLAIRHAGEIRAADQGLVRRSMTAIRHALGADRPPVDPHAAARMNERLHLQRRLDAAEGDPDLQAHLRDEIDGVDRDLTRLGYPEPARELRWIGRPWHAEGRVPTIDELLPRSEAEAGRWSEHAAAEIARQLDERRIGTRALRLAGDAAITVRPDEMVIRLRVDDRNGVPLGTETRVLIREPDGSVVARHEGVSLDPRVDRQLAEWYRESGVDRIEAPAIGRDGYELARRGYSWGTGTEAADVARILTGLDERVRDIRHALDTLADGGADVPALRERFGGGTVEETAANMRRELTAGQGLLRRAAEHPFGDPRFPRPEEFARAGTEAGWHRGGTSLGVEVMAGESWHAELPLREPAHAAAEPVAVEHVRPGETSPERRWQQHELVWDGRRDTTYGQKLMLGPDGKDHFPGDRVGTSRNRDGRPRVGSRNVEDDNPPPTGDAAARAVPDRGSERQYDPTGDSTTEVGVRQAAEARASFEAQRNEVWNRHLAPLARVLQGHGITLDAQHLGGASLRDTLTKAAPFLSDAQSSALRARGIEYIRLTKEVKLASEKLGTAGGDLIVERHFPGARELTGAVSDKPGTPQNIDRILLVEDPRQGGPAIIAIEEKGAGSTLQARNVENPADLGGVMIRAEQCSPEYLRHMLQHDVKLRPLLEERPELRPLLQSIISSERLGSLRFLKVHAAADGRVTVTEYLLDHDRLQPGTIRLVGDEPLRTGDHD